MNNTISFGRLEMLSKIAKENHFPKIYEEVWNRKLVNVMTEDKYLRVRNAMFKNDPQTALRILSHYEPKDFQPEINQLLNFVTE